MKGLWMGSSFCVGRGGDQVMDIYLCGMGLSGSPYKGSLRGLAVKRGHGVPIAKLNFIKNRGHNMSPIYF